MFAFLRDFGARALKLEIFNHEITLRQINFLVLIRLQPTLALLAVFFCFLFHGASFERTMAFKAVGGLGNRSCFTRACARVRRACMWDFL